MSLAKQESIYLEKKIGRKPTSTEFQIVAAEWSEHCSYKSSKKHLKMLPMSGSNVISEKGYDSGVLDVGENYVVTVHIESHNHPSAVEPFGGAATGVGGVIRDILSAGTRPIGILDGLRFGDIEKDPHARWLFKNAVSGIADYGNCLGIPTIGGEVEFDNCYANYALVDVAAIGFGKKDKLIKNIAIKGDLVVLIGGPTGRDGIGGSQFASDSLESENRSAVQIPDPFIEKLIIEAILEARDQKCIKAMKDLGGGGLSCAVSETADSLGVGIELDVNQIHTRESNMKPDEIMVSESQERMLIITDKKKLNTLKTICKKFRIQCSVIGKVQTDSLMQVKKGAKILAALPPKIVANAPLLDRPSAIPKYLNKLQKNPFLKTPTNFSNILLKMISSPNIANKRWVYGQYDHEVGIRTVIKPGNDVLVIVGQTKNELGGSEYIEYIHGLIGGKSPEVDFKASKQNMETILEVIRKDIVKCIHDCSKGGLAIAVSELCMINNIGCKIYLEKIPSEKLQTDRLLFSESHSRYLVVIAKKNLKKIQNLLSKKKVQYNVIGNFGGSKIIIERNSKKIANLRVDKARLKWMNSLEELVLHG